MTVVQGLTNRYSRHRFAFLFFSLLVTLVAAPVIAALGYSTGFMEAFLAVNILAAVLITQFSFRAYIGLGLLVLAVASKGAHVILQHEPLLATSYGAEAAICLLSVTIMFRYILSEGRVTSERIFAALSTYLMLGIMCGLLFGILEERWPGSFSVHGSLLGGSRQMRLAHTIYFSFVTLGTLGYGDITPMSGPARALAVAESIGGQMYLVLVVARLVSMYQEGIDRDNRQQRDQAAKIDDGPQP